MPSLPGPFPFGLGGSSTAPSSSGTASITTPTNSGNVSVTNADFITSLLPPLYRGQTVWSALVAAIATVDDYKEEQKALAWDQLWISSASDKYLTARASTVGVDRPDAVGLDDETFRELAISLNSGKLTVDSIASTLETIYGVDALRANQTSTQAEPYAIGDGDQLVIYVDDDDTVVTFRSTDFQTPGAAKAQEVVEAINRQFRLLGRRHYAAVWTDPTDNSKSVRLYSAARGLGGVVRVEGGKAQNVLLFPNKSSVSSNGVTWTITKSSSTMRFSASSDPGFSGLQAGDYVSIFGANFNASNRGSYVLTDVSVAAASRYFEIENVAGVAETVVQTDAADLIFYHPDVSTIQSGSRLALVTQPVNKKVTITMPVTTALVNREPLEAAYIQSPVAIGIAGIVRDADGVVTVTTSLNHGLDVGQNVFIDDVEPGSTTPGAFSAGGLNGHFVVTAVLTAQIFTYETPEFKTITTSTMSGTVTPITAVVATNPIGPYSFDPAGGVAITDIQTTTTQQLDQNGQYANLSVVDASEFPDQAGWLVISFGKANQAAPVPYRGRASDTLLLLDYGYRFAQTIESGATVTRLSQKGPYVPVRPQETGAFYCTASNVGLQYAQSLVDDIVAQGFEVEKDILYPSDRGLGGEGFGTEGTKVSDIVNVFGPDGDDHAV